jgi:ATP-binding cassette subfamily F protein 2
MENLDIDEVKDIKREEALEELSKENINVVYESKKGALHANTRDINVNGVTVTFHGKSLIEETGIQINYGNRYGFIGKLIVGFLFHTLNFQYSRIFSH